MAILQGINTTQLGSGVFADTLSILPAWNTITGFEAEQITPTQGGVIVGVPNGSRMIVLGDINGTTLEGLSGNATSLEVIFNPGTAAESHFLFAEFSIPVQQFVQGQVTLGGILSGNDTVIGTDAADIDNQTSIRQGDNTAGFNGDDRYEAGAGADSWEVRGGRSDYTLVKLGTGQYRLTDSVGGRDGSDTLVDAEVIKFMNVGGSGLEQVVFLPGSADEATVARLYSAALGREPDSGGLTYWTQVVREGNSVEAIAQAFVNSQEFQTLFNGADNQAVVEQLYQNVLGRPGEQGGIDFWTGALDQGEPLFKVVIGFADSAENIDGTAQTWLLGTV